MRLDSLSSVRGRSWYLLPGGKKEWGGGLVVVWELPFADFHQQPWKTPLGFSAPFSGPRENVKEERSMHMKKEDY